MPNKRIFYASHGVSIDTETVSGAQSVAINTSFNLEQVFQLGRLAIYDNFPTDPELDITINKALDGRKLMFNMYAGQNSSSLVESSNETSDIVLMVGDDTADFINVGTSSITMTGCYLSSLNYTFPIDGNFTEELTFVGSHKASGGSVTAPVEDPVDRVVRRQNFRLHGQDGTILPSEIRGKCLNSASISADLGREKMFCLGEYSPFHRYVNFPLEITVSFDVNQDGNAGTALVGPDFDVEDIGQCEAGTIVDKQPILLNICSTEDVPNIAYSFDLGSGCALQSVSYSGGDTGGGNVTETYTYITYNDLTITYTQ